jgi:hypothetical protein
VPFTLSRSEAPRTNRSHSKFPGNNTLLVERWMRAITSALLATALISGAAFAEDLRPIEAQPISLNDVTGSAYYVVKPDAFHLVATVAAGEAATPIRFSSTLAPGQVVTISVPGRVGTSGTQIEFKRLGDQVFATSSRILALAD